MPTYMPSRSDIKQGLTALGKKGRPKSKFGLSMDPTVSAGLASEPRQTVERPAGMKKGGSASNRADGCCSKGKTKGKMVTMCGGGMAK